MTTAILDEYDACDLDLLGLVARTMESALDARQVEDGPAARPKQHEGLLDWGRAYLPHYFSDPSSKMHEWLADKADASRRRRGRFINCVGPREGAKSTIISTAHALRCAVDRSETLIWIVGETQSQADTNLEHIKSELTENPQIARDYPDAAGRGPVWRSSAITLRNGVVIQAFGLGSKIRGRRRRSDRPTLVICDDIQSDLAMHSSDRRDKNWRWFTGALLKAGSKRTNVFNLANAVHRDAIGVRLTRTPGWDSKTFAAILQWPENMGLWEEWAQLWNDVFNPKASDEAETFVIEHHDEMMRGAELLWPEHEDLITLMQIRERDGHQAFEREKQSRPINPEECEWPETCFENILFDDWPEAFDLRVMALDPSKGKDAKRGDYSAFAMLQITDNVLYVDMDLARRPVPDIVRDGVELYRKFQPHAFGVEGNQFQELLGSLFFEEFRRRNILGTEPHMLNNVVNKQVRIRTLGPFLSQRRIRFKSGSPGCLLTISQMRDFPDRDAHDDGPDALEMAVRLASQMFRELYDEEG